MRAGALNRRADDARLVTVIINLALVTAGDAHEQPLLRPAVVQVNSASEHRVARVREEGLAFGRFRVRLKRERHSRRNNAGQLLAADTFCMARSGRVADGPTEERRRQA